LLNGLKLLSRGASLELIASSLGKRLPFLWLGCCQPSSCRRPFDNLLLLSLWGLLLSVLLPRTGGLVSLNFLRVIRLVARSLEPRPLFPRPLESYDSAEENEALLRFFSESVRWCRGAGDCDPLGDIDLGALLRGGECDRLA
jgi:hypothetical protein